jgi:hypothetical protein
VSSGSIFTTNAVDGGWRELEDDEAAAEEEEPRQQYAADSRFENAGGGATSYPLKRYDPQIRVGADLFRLRLLTGSLARALAALETVSAAANLAAPATEHHGSQAGGGEAEELLDLRARRRLLAGGKRISRRREAGRRWSGWGLAPIGLSDRHIYRLFGVLGCGLDSFYWPKKRPKSVYQFKLAFALCRSICGVYWRCSNTSFYYKL